jgi:hypothetical protein
MERAARRVVGCLVVVLCLARGERPASASGLVMGRVSVDLCDAATASQRARWAFPDRIGVNASGLGWDGSPRSSLDAWVETTEPIGVGTSWHAARRVGLTVSVPWTRVEGPEPIGSLFVRFGTDSVHWSDWMALERETAPKSGVETFRGSVAVPRREQERYRARRGRLAKEREIPEGGDEEAALRAILLEDPAFLAENRPFVGWVQFLWEGSAYAGARLPSIDVRWTAVIPGPSAAPDPARHDPWRFRATPPK